MSSQVIDTVPFLCGRHKIHIMFQHHNVDPLYATTTQIKFPNDDAHGTGFFYNQAGETYLITNRHVIRDEEEGHTPDLFRFFIRGHHDLRELSWIDCSIENGESNDWFAHSHYPDADVVAIPLDQTLSTLSDIGNEVTGSLAFSENELMQDDERIRGGKSALIIGYPGTFVDRATYFPVIRDARIASPYGVQFNDQPLFITDARMHGGTSGSPVLADPSSLTRSPDGGLVIGGQRIALLGVHSATFKQPNVNDAGEEWLDLNTAWFAELVDDITQTI